MARKLVVYIPIGRVIYTGLASSSFLPYPRNVESGCRIGIIITEYGVHVRQLLWFSVLHNCRWRVFENSSIVIIPLFLLIHNIERKQSTHSCHDKIAPLFACGKSPPFVSLAP
jgi:hypothetical protein